jgi:transposase
VYARTQEVEMPRADREEWAKRVQRWQDSGLSAREFASEMGLKASSLSFWKWRLKKDEATAAKPASRMKLARRQSAAAVRFVELAAPAPMSSLARDARFEVVLATATIRAPDRFDDTTLRRLLAIVRERS